MTMTPPNIIIYSNPRSGTTLLHHTLLLFFQEYYGDYYCDLHEFFTTSHMTTRHRNNIDEINSITYEQNNNILIKTYKPADTESNDFEEELQQRISQWNNCVIADNNQPFITKIFHKNLIDHNFSNTIFDHSLNLVLVRKNVQDMILSFIISNSNNNWFYYENENIETLRGSLIGDIDIIRIHLERNKLFLENIPNIPNALIIDYDELNDYEYFYQVIIDMGIVDIRELHAMEIFDNIQLKRKIIPTPYTMDRIDYFKNANEIKTLMDEYCS